MAYSISMAYTINPEFEFEITDTTTVDKNGRVQLPFYRWVGSPKVEDASGIPTSAIQTGKGFGKADAFAIQYSGGVVSERFKDIIESFEPGVHQFFPITLKRRNGEPYAEKFFLFHVTQRAACVLREETDWVDVGRVKGGARKGAPYYSTPTLGLVVSRPALEGRQMATATFIGGGALVVTDAIGECLKKEKIRNIDIHPVGESDRPWLPEENVSELLDFYDEHPEHRESFDPL